MCFLIVGEIYSLHDTPPLPNLVIIETLPGVPQYEELNPFQ